jgi:hypothetical protein
MKEKFYEQLFGSDFFTAEAQGRKEGAKIYGVIMGDEESAWA